MGIWNIYDMILPKIGVFFRKRPFPSFNFCVLARARAARASRFLGNRRSDQAKILRDDQYPHNV